MKQRELFNKNFIIIFICDVLSNISDAFCLFAVSWHIISVTKSSISLSWYAVLGIIPVLFCFPIGGAAADKFSRKKIVVFADLLRGITYLGCAAFLYMNPVNLWSLYLLSFILGICEGFYSPAMTAIIPNAVAEESLVKANSLFSVDSGLSMIIGVLLGGISVSVYKVELIIFAAGIIYIACFVLETLLSNNLQTFQQEKIAGSVSKFMLQIKEGGKYLKSKKALWTIFIFFLVVNFLTSPLSTIYLPFLFNQILAAKAVQLSYVQISYGVGYILLACLSITVLKRRDNIKQIFLGILLEGLTIFAVGFTVNPVLLMQGSKSMNINCIIFIASVIGCGVSLVNININTYFQAVVEDSYRGRVIGLINVMLKIAMPLGYLIGGFLSNVIPMFLIFIVTGIFLMGLTILISHSKRNFFVPNQNDETQI